MPDADPSPQLVALGRDVQRTSHRVDRIETVLRLLSQQVAELTSTVQDTEPEPASVRSWLLAEDTTQAHTDLTDLVQWLERVYLRYPDTALASCWLWHPAVVEELWWLRQAHHDAYTGPQASATRAGDWHDRQRPGVTRRIRTALGDCELALHAQPRPVQLVPLVGAVDRIATTWTTTRTMPLPTSGELAQAEDHEDHQRRTSRR